MKGSPVALTWLDEVSGCLANSASVEEGAGIQLHSEREMSVAQRKHRCDHSYRRQPRYMSCRRWPVYPEPVTPV